MNDLFGNHGTNAYGDPITLAGAEAARDAAVEQVADNAASGFVEAARAFVLTYLREHGPTPAEDVNDACRAAGITTKNAKAFGAVYGPLSRKGLIRKAGYCARRYGHATSGGVIWEIVG